MVGSEMSLEKKDKKFNVSSCTQIERLQYIVSQKSFT